MGLDAVRRAKLSVSPSTKSASGYQPVSRRPIADMFRQTAHWAVRVCVRARIHPDVISYLSMVAAGLAGICFWQASAHPWLLLIGAGFCYARLWCNMLDGMVALASGKASWRGEILNDLPDRISDVVIFAGVAHSGLNAVASGYWAAIFALLTAYVGLFGQALGVRREFSGWMSKPWRMAVLHVGAWVTLGLIWWRHGDIRWGNLTVLDWTCTIVVLGCVQTLWVRLSRILPALREKDRK
jgi:phosphatidylglycerophosphate synthase